MIPDTSRFNECINESDPIKSDPIQLYLWNSRSLVNKLKHFNSFIHASNYKIFGITETWLSNHINDNEIIPPNLTVYHTDCSSCGGNVMLAMDTSRDPPIMLKILPIMLCCTAQKLCLLCSNYAH